MKKLLVVLIAFLCIPLCAFADLKIVQKVESSGMMGQPPSSHTMTLYMKGGKARIEQPDNIGTSIVDLDAGKVYVLNSKDKTAVVMSTDQMKQATDMLAHMTGGAKPETKAVKTGNSKTVNGFKCDEWHVTMSGGVLNMDSLQCVTQDVGLQDFERFRPFTQDMAKSFGSVDMKGIPVETTSKMKILGKEVTSKSQILSVTHEPVADSMFVVPAEYSKKEMKLPGKQ
jgi:hypothetical protein